MSDQTAQSVIFEATKEEFPFILSPEVSDPIDAFLGLLESEESHGGTLTNEGNARYKRLLNAILVRHSLGVVERVAAFSAAREKTWLDEIDLSRNTDMKYAAIEAKSAARAIRESALPLAAGDIWS